MFKIFRKNTEIQQHKILDKLGLFSVQDGASLLDEPHFQAKLQELKQLVSITQNNYQTFYINLIYKFAELVQCLPDSQKDSVYDRPKGMLQHGLERAITALKYRRGYMLPVGADTETCYKQQEVWTYAIFTAALLRDAGHAVTLFDITIMDPAENEQYNWYPLCDVALPKGKYYRIKRKAFCEFSQAAINPLLIKHLLCSASFRWLHQYDMLFQYWLNFLSGHLTPQNTISEIIQKAELSINTISDNKPDSKIPETISEVRVAEEKPVTITTSNDNQDISIAFISWLKDGLKNDVFSINHNESFLHQIAEGIFVVMPLALDNFLKENEQSFYTIKNKNPIEFFIQQLKLSNYLIPVHEDNYLHEYYLGEWKKRHVLQGLLMPTHLIIEDPSAIQINKNLNREEKIY